MSEPGRRRRQAGGRVELPEGYGIGRRGGLQGPLPFRSFRPLRKCRPPRRRRAGPTDGVNSPGRCPISPCDDIPTAKPGPPRRARSRYGYDHRWWGESAAATAEDRSYWSTTRRPLPGLVFILPILIAYEAGVIWLGRPLGRCPPGRADAWVRQGLARSGLTDRWLLPIALVRVSSAGRPSTAATGGSTRPCCGGWRSRAWSWPSPGRPEQAGRPRLLPARRARASWPRHPARPDRPGGRVPGGGALRGGPVPPGHDPPALPVAPAAPGPLAGGLHAGGDGVVAGLLAGPPCGGPGEAFTWFAFIFRWLAGVFFAWVFVVRGFGVAVGTHTAYDLLVGWFDWHSDLAHPRSRSRADHPAVRHPRLAIFVQPVPPVQQAGGRDRQPAGRSGQEIPAGAAGRGGGSARDSRPTTS